MIRLVRPAEPAPLAQRAAKATSRLWRSWGRHQTVTVTGLYRHREVKKTLRDAQHNKCAYCETLMSRSHGAVEHFRPKSCWQQYQRGPVNVPGYFWLSYHWPNLLFGCDICNDGAHKGTVFPLSNPRRRATHLAPDHTPEHPLLLNPYEDDPAQHLDWNADIPRPRNGSKRGRTSIRIFGLNHDESLLDARRGYLEHIERLLSVVEEYSVSHQKQLELEGVLRAAIDDSAPYAGMIRQNFGVRIAAL